MNPARENSFLQCRLAFATNRVAPRLRLIFEAVVEPLEFLRWLAHRARQQGADMTFEDGIGLDPNVYRWLPVSNNSYNSGSDNTASLYKPMGYLRNSGQGNLGLTAQAGFLLVGKPSGYSGHLGLCR